MRLLNTTTLEFKEFLGSDIPQYAILSHVWSDEEVSYEDFLAGKGKDGYGYRKIVKLCQLTRNALRDRTIAWLCEIDRSPGTVPPIIEWAWIDTCCIDKRSSAELSEAINSMFKWYERANVCFVFLPDVHPQPFELHDLDKEADIDGKATRRIDLSEQEFLNSKWFTRGWTLQELLAPTTIIFFNTAFEPIGNRSDLSRLIAPAANMDKSAVRKYKSTRFCIAQKMSWASHRRTTREEDMAYCLLGLFDVNMPLLYGEGADNAFLRLQTEILARSTDDSIFAWDVINEPGFPRPGFPTIVFPFSGMLAPSPRNFKMSGNICLIKMSHQFTRSQQPKLPMPTISSRGLELSLPVTHHTNIHHKNLKGAVYPLSCKREGRGRIFVKIWIDYLPALEKDYADGAKLAWRSGCVTIDSDDTSEMVSNTTKDKSNALPPLAQSKKLTLAFQGVHTPELLQLSSTEKSIYKMMIAEGPLGGHPHFRRKALLAERCYRRLKLNKEKDIRLYFKTNFDPVTAPDIALLSKWIRFSTEDHSSADRRPASAAM